MFLSESDHFENSTQTPDPILAQPSATRGKILSRNSKPYFAHSILSSRLGRVNMRHHD